MPAWVDAVLPRMAMVVDEAREAAQERAEREAERNARR